MIGLPRDIQKALQHLPLKAGMTVVQFGMQKRAHVATAVAQLVGAEGQVLLFDVLADDLASVKKYIASQSIHNIDARLGDFTRQGGTKLSPRSADCVIIAHTAWRNPRHEDVLAEARRILKPGGYILFLDWQKQTAHPLGQHVHGHLDLYEAQRLCMQSGCERVERILNNERHWAFVLTFPLDETP